MTTGEKNMIGTGLKSSCKDASKAARKITHKQVHPQVLGSCRGSHALVYLCALYWLTYSFLHRILPGKPSQRLPILMFTALIITALLVTKRDRILMQRCTGGKYPIHNISLHIQLSQILVPQRRSWWHRVRLLPPHLPGIWLINAVSSVQR